MTLDELKQSCKTEFENIDKIMNELFSVYEPGKTEHSIVEQAAIATFLMNAYSGIENILKQVLLYDKLDVKDSPGWHEMVLKKSGEIGILPPDLIQILSNYLAFRNYFIYTYIYTLNWDDITKLADASKDLLSKVHTEVDEYLQTIS